MRFNGIHRYQQFFVFGFFHSRKFKEISEDRLTGHLRNYPDLSFFRLILYPGRSMVIDGDAIMPPDSTEEIGINWDLSGCVS